MFTYTKPVHHSSHITSFIVSPAWLLGSWASWTSVGNYLSPHKSYHIYTYIQEKKYIIVCNYRRWTIKAYLKKLFFNNISNGLIYMSNCLPNKIFYSLGSLLCNTKFGKYEISLQQSKLIFDVLYYKIN